MRGALSSVVGPEAALQEGEIGDQADLRGGSLQDGAGDLLAVVFHADIADAELRLDVLKCRRRRATTWGSVRSAITSSRLSFLRASISVVGRTPITGM